jgi:hypothetical protein
MSDYTDPKRVRLLAPDSSPAPRFKRGYLVFGRERIDGPSEQLTIAPFDILGNSLHVTSIRLTCAFHPYDLRVATLLPSEISVLELLSFTMNDENQLMCPVPARMFDPDLPLQLALPRGRANSAVSLQFHNHSSETVRLCAWMHGDYQEET